MNKSAAIGLLLAITLPLLGYWLVSIKSKNGVNMPPHYFYDSVSTTSQNGKLVKDTIWHQVKNIEVTNQFGNTVHLYDLKNRIIVIDFFFTRCPSICPRMTGSMKKMQQAFAKNDSLVHFISFSVDPIHDSVQNLRKFADRFGVNHDNWWFVTGKKDSIYQFALQELKANIADTDVDTGFIHTENFFLLDSNKVLRGWYNAFDSTKQYKLAHDIAALSLEKNKHSTSVLRGFIPILPYIFAGIGITILVMIWLQKKRTVKEKIHKRTI